MCGIAGRFSPAGIDPGTLPPMAEAIRHRGPDGHGYLLHRPSSGIEVSREIERDGGSREAPRVGFAHRRLSIIDLSAENDQPMVDAQRRRALVFNGEIYNYLELRAELRDLGHRFRTAGDTEALLAAYTEWGPACVERMVGMWAFAILDLERGLLFLSRDRFGIKPLYWSIDGGLFSFASEIKGLLAGSRSAPAPDEGTVRRYLISGAVDESDRTFFEGIFSLPPAHNLSLALDAAPAAPRPERYWSLPPEGYRGGRQKAARRFGALLTESVAMHARSDVPVGTCLSGGLDSSSIVCVAERLRAAGAIPSYAHHGFGYVPTEEQFSERRYMDEVARDTSLEMTYVEIPPERFADSLATIVRQQDEPFGSTSIAAQWFVFEAARRGGMKVMLDGQGADEVLGGYHGYFTLIALALLRSRRPLAYSRFAAAHRRELGRTPVPARRAVAELVRGPASGDPPSSPPPPVLGVLTPELGERLAPADYAAHQFDSVHELLAAHTTSLGLPSLLRFEDRNSMAHSIEARVPFLDHRLVEFGFRLPPEYKVRGMDTKHILREALRGVLPEPVRTRRDKIGFRADPRAVWTLAERHREALIEEGTDAEARWFDRAGVEELLDGSDRSTEAEWLAWRVINTKLWLRTFWGDGGEPLA
jgi:asparagine synthase (glutamine-hydrolysing)